MANGGIFGKDGRGRPSFISPEEATRFLDRLDRAARTLAAEREISHGFRDPRILGETGGSLPEWMEFARVVAMQAERGQAVTLSRSALREVREAMKLTRSLAAAQSTYRERALVRLQTEDYERAAAQARAVLTAERQQRLIDTIVSRFESMDQTQRASFFRSRSYQDIRSAFVNIRKETDRYARARAWAYDHMLAEGLISEGEELTTEEALLYIISTK